MYIVKHVPGFKTIETVIQTETKNLFLSYMVDLNGKEQLQINFYKPNNHHFYQSRTYPLIYIPEKYLVSFYQLQRQSSYCPIDHKLVISQNELTRKDDLVS